MQARRDRTTQAVLFALGAASLWGISATVAAHTFTELSPPRVAQARASLAAAVLVPYALWLGSFRFRELRWEVAGLGLNLAAVSVTFYWAIERLGVGVGVTLEFLGPVLVLFWMRRVQRRPVHLGLWGAAAASLLGTVLITRAWDAASLDLAGLAAGLAAAGFFASYLVWGERLGRRLSAPAVMAGAFLAAAAAWAVVLPWWEFPPVSGRVGLELLWVGVMTAVAFLAALAALRRAPAGMVGVVTTAEPFVAGLSAWVVLGQTLLPIQILGGLLILGAVVAAQRWGQAVGTASSAGKA
ncbi:MAG: EamA family transporter [Acidimicrobiia bacterium]